MAGKEVYVDSQRRRQERKTSTGDDVAAAKATERMSSTLGAGLKGSAGRTPMPKQADYSSMADFAAAMRRWRASDDNAARRKAME